MSGSKKFKIAKNYSSSSTMSLTDRLASLSVQFVDDLVSINSSLFRSSHSSLSSSSSSPVLSPTSSTTQSQQQKILAKLGPIVSTTRSMITKSTNELDSDPGPRSGYIVSFVIIFVIVLFILVGRVIYSSNESAAPNIAYLKYHRASVAATALSQRGEQLAIAKTTTTQQHR